MSQKEKNPKRFLSSFQELMEEWDTNRNTEDPSKLTHGSAKKVWWLCKDKGHSYPAKVLHRTISKSGCPYCKNRLPSDDNNLAVLHPNLMKSWDFERNSHLTPEELVPGSHKKVYWKCDKGHSWKAVIKSRALLGVGCPKCAGISKEVPAEQSLSKLRPDFHEIWDEEKNSKSLKQLRPGSALKAHFKGNCGHFWKEKISNQSRYEGDGHCPYCNGRKPFPENNLGSHHDLLVSEWNFSENEGRPEDYLPGSHAQINWVCKKHGHKFKKSIRERAVKGHNCPFCSNKQVSEQNNLATKNPEVLELWHEEKNVAPPESFLPGSHTRVWWKCSRGHEWKTSIKSVAKGSRCPKCSNQTSKPEIRIFCELKTIFGELAQREKRDGIEVDIFSPDKLISIEYDGAYYHEDKLANDKAKYDHLSQMGIVPINVREHPLSSFHSSCVSVHPARLVKKDVDRILDLIGSLVDLTKEERELIETYKARKSFANQSEFRRFISALPGPVVENSLEAKFPKVAEEWHPEKNRPLVPSNFAPKSSHKVWWQCSQHGSHIWQAAISARTFSGTGCPYCAGNHPSATNNLSASFPDVAEYFHPELNGDAKPTDFTSKSNKKVWWSCTECKRPFERGIGIRIKSPLCSSCSYKARAKKRKKK